MRKRLILFISIWFLLACSDKNKEASPDAPAPVKTSLLFPLQNEACTSGTVVSETKSSLVFRWNTAENTDSYEVVLKNLATQAESKIVVKETQAEVTLDRNTPYSWQVISKSSKSNKIAQSDVWKFYNAGPGISSYAPFPAEIVSPTFAQEISASNGKITLRWNGSDVDNDIVGYTIYFGKSQTPPLFINDLLENTLTVDVTSNTTYYWKIITKDRQANSSDSRVYQFKVN